MQIMSLKKFIEVGGIHPLNAVAHLSGEYRDTVYKYVYCEAPRGAVLSLIMCRDTEKFRCYSLEKGDLSASDFVSLKVFAERHIDFSNSVCHFCPVYDDLVNNRMS